MVLDKSFWYIDWSKANHVRLTQSEYNSKLEWYSKHGSLVDNRRDAGNRTRKLSWTKPFSYCMDRDHQQVNLYTTDKDFNFTVYYTFCDSTKCDRNLGVSGGAAFRLVEDMFKERHDRSLQSAFGRCETDFIFDTINMALAPII